MLRAAILILLLTACAPTREDISAVHGADVASTVVGLALGAAANTAFFSSCPLLFNFHRR